jgi:uncharacterized peroxidase-related enzyme
MRRIRADGVEADLDPRRRAVVAFAAKLTADPAALAGEDAQSLRAAGLNDQEILDLVHAVAMFAWANRLMQSLGEVGAAGEPGSPWSEPGGSAAKVG